MSRTTKLRVTLLLLFVTQIILLFLEANFLKNFTGNDNLLIVKRVRNPAFEELIHGQYVVLRFYKSEGFAADGINPVDVTIALHGTVDRLHRLIEFADVWNGPISLSVFAPSNDASFLDDAIDGLRQCWHTLRQRVTFHMVYPRSFPIDMSRAGSVTFLSCRDIAGRLRRKTATEFHSRSMPYPHNVMRDVARGGVITNWVLHLDVETLPTSNLRMRFQDFIKKFEEKLKNQR